MNGQIKLPTDLYSDDLICFLADRYHTTPMKVMQCYLVQDGVVKLEEPMLFRLEENEMEMLRGLTRGVVCKAYSYG